MNFNRMRQIDRFVGVPLCFLLTCWRYTFGQGRGPQKSESPKRILFLKLIEQGSTVLTNSTLKRAVDLVGKENVYFWLFEENLPVLSLMNIVRHENIIVVRIKSGLLTFAVDMLKAIWKVRSANIDALVDMEFFARAPALLSYLSGARIRVGVHRFTSEAPYRGDLMTHRVNYNYYIHTAAFFRLLLDAAFADPKDLPLLKTPVDQSAFVLPEFQPSAEDQRLMWAKLKSQKADIDRGPIVLLNANASDLIPLRKWDAEKYQEVARRIIKKYPNASIVFTGAPSEQKPIDEIVASLNLPQAISMAGKTTFRELMVLYSLSDVLVTNDSGPGHFSSMTKIYAITLFGPETPILYGALGENKIAISANLSCSPCVSSFNHRFSPCTNNRCMQEISVERVCQEIEKGINIRAQSEKTHTTAHAV